MPKNSKAPRKRRIGEAYRSLTIPQTPHFKSETYEIPEEYIQRYKSTGITDGQQQKILFHLTQFGGFRFYSGKIPKWFRGSEKFVGRWCEQKKEGSTYKYRANPKFIREFGGMEVEPLRRYWRISFMDLEEMQEYKYSREQIGEIGNFLNELNRFYEKLSLRVDFPRSGISEGERVQMSRFHSVPFLRIKPKSGGRLFHPETSYQRVISQLRPFIKINGEKAAETDLSAATLQFINIAIESAGTGSIRDSVLSFADPYDYFLSSLNSETNFDITDGKRICREDVKQFLYTLIYSPKNKQESNLNHKLGKFGLKARYSHFASMFGEFFEAMKSLNALANGNPGHLVINREESNYARAVLKKGCLEGKIPILPIHDSFITTRSHVEDLERIMDETATEMYGRKLKHKRKY